MPEKTLRKLTIIFGLLLILSSVTWAVESNDSSYSKIFRSDILELKRTKQKSVFSFTIEKSLSSNKYIGHLFSVGLIDLWEKDSDLSYFINLDHLTNRIWDCDLTDDLDLLAMIYSPFYSTSVYLAVVNLTSGSFANRTAIDSSYKSSKVQLTQENIYIFSQERNKLLKYSRAELSVYNEFQLTGMQQVNQMRVCEIAQPTSEQLSKINSLQNIVGQDSLLETLTRPVTDYQTVNSELVMASDQNSNLGFFLCSKNQYLADSCVLVDSLNVGGQPTQKMLSAFSADCRSMLSNYRAASFQQLSILSDLGGSLESMNQFLGGAIDMVVDFWFNEYSSSDYIVMFDNSSVSVFSSQVSDSPLIGNYPVVGGMTHADYDFSRDKLYLMNQDYIYVYQFACSDVQSAENQTYLSWKTLCSADLYEAPQVQEISNHSDSVQNVDDQNVSDATVEQISGQDSNKEQTEPQPEAPKKQLFSAAETAVQSLTQVSKYVILTASVLPFSALLLKFISFWVVCSFYSFLNFGMPSYLREFLAGIFVSVNASLFKLLGIDFQLLVFLNSEKNNEKLDSEYLEFYSISSDFALMNAENITIFLFSSLVICCYWLISKTRFEFDSLQYAKRKNTAVELIVGQVVSILPLFFIGAWNISAGSQCLTFAEKLNKIIYFTAIGAGVCFPFLAVGLNGNQKSPKQLESSLQLPKYIEEQPIEAFTVEGRDEIRISSCEINKSEQSKRFQEKIKRLNGFVLMQCNVLTPFTALFLDTAIFMVINLALYVAGMYAALKEPDIGTARTVNSVVRSAWLVVFHCSMLMVFSLGEDEHPEVNYICCMVCIGVVILGAVHEVLNLFVVDLGIDFLMPMFASVLNSFKGSTVERCQSEQSNSAKGSHDQIRINILKTTKTGNRSQSFRLPTTVNNPSTLSQRQVINLPQSKAEFNSDANSIIFDSGEYCSDISSITQNAKKKHRFACIENNSHQTNDPLESFDPNQLNNTFSDASERYFNEQFSATFMAFQALLEPKDCKFQKKVRYKSSRKSPVSKKIKTSKALSTDCPMKIQNIGSTRD